MPTAQRLAAHDGNVTALLQVGDRSASRSFIERDFPDTVLGRGFGHDGQQFYIMARTFPDMQKADGHVDRLLYRARRVLLPALASPFSAGPPTVWAMLAISLASIGLAAVALGRLAPRVGAPAWAGISAGLSPALAISARASLADALAVALALWGLVLWRRRLWPAVFLFVLAGLARETALVAPLMCLVFADKRARLALLTPFAVYGAWLTLTGSWLEPVLSRSDESLLGDLGRLFTFPPFRSWVDVGLDSPAVLAAGLLGAGSVVAAWRIRGQLPELALWLVADAVLLVLAGTEIAVDPLNFARVVPLAVPGMALASSVAFRLRR